MAKTTIEIDEALLEQAMTLSGSKTKKQLLHIALQEYVWRLGQQRFIADIVSGKLQGVVSMTHEELMAQRRKEREQARQLSEWLKGERDEPPG